jgi:hypothetical protein
MMVSPYSFEWFSKPEVWNSCIIIQVRTAGAVVEGAEMTESGAGKSYSLEADDKATPVMVYTLNHLTWGEVVTKEVIRLSTWLRTQAAPQTIRLHNAQMMYVGGGPMASISMAEMNIPIAQVRAFHMLPPHQDPPDYDPNEPNRKMVPVTALVGSFRFDGLLRMSTQSNLYNFLEVIKEVYTSLYEVKISQPERPSMAALQVPYTLIRRDAALFCVIQS